jgi:broad specificity phosphatase PhoE
VALYFKEKQIDAVYSSPLKRALFTAKAIAYYHNLPVHIEKDLREIDVGNLEGVPLTELSADLSSVLIGFESDSSKQLPGGESLADVRKRAMEVVRRILAENLRSVVIVGHYFVVLSIITAVLDMPADSIKRMRIKNGSVSILDFENDRGTLYCLNDTCHQV